MAKCSLVGCANKPIGGFQKIIDAGTLDDPSATLLGTRTNWCEAHQEMLRPSTYGKRGRYLRSDELG
jgi:hypothetical protein